MNEPYLLYDALADRIKTKKNLIDEIVKQHVNRLEHARGK